jgi:sn-glycerol 3-phosphate transport system substrate-binding protein
MSNNWKKGLMTLTAVAIVLTGCGGNEKNESEVFASASETASVSAPASESPVASAKTVNIDFWFGYSDSYAGPINQLIEGFNASHSNIHVSGVNNGDIDTNGTKLQAALIAGTQPAAVVMDTTQMGQFAGALEDLAGYYSADEISQFNEGLLKNSYVGEKLAGVPYSRTVPVLYYNKDYFAKASLGEQAPKTWDELHQFALKLTDKANGIFGYTMPVDMVFIESGIYQQGGTVLSEDNKHPAFDNEAGYAIVKLMQDMQKDGSGAFPTSQQAYMEAVQSFMSGKAAMLPSSSALLPSVLAATQGKMSIGVATLPAGKETAMPTTGTNLVIMKKASDAEKKAAAEFIKFLTGPDQIVGFAQSGVVPSTQAAVDSDAIKQLWEKTPQLKVAYDSLQFAKARPVVKSYREMGIKIENEIKKALQDPSITPEAAMKEAAKQVQSILDENS